MSLSTPSRMSLMTSGGMRRERISERDSGLMLPTARWASSTRGWKTSVGTKVSERYAGLRTQRVDTRGRVRAGGSVSLLGLRSGRDSVRLRRSHCDVHARFGQGVTPPPQEKPQAHLDFLQLLIDLGFALFDLQHFLRHLAFDLLHLRLLIAGVLIQIRLAVSPSTQKYTH